MTGRRAGQEAGRGPAGSPHTGQTSAAATDAGLLRDRNEDRYWMDSEHGIFLVVDGVGGNPGGELAAQTAVEAIRETIYVSDPPEQRVRRAITCANNRIFKARRGMACVLTLALVEDGRMTIGHVGDSRLYLLWNGTIRKLTRDHSPVGEDEDSGGLTEEEAMLHPRRHEVYRDVGSRLRTSDDPEFIEIRQCRLRPDAAILLCSDGLTDQLTSEQVREIVESYAGDPERVTRDLVAAANAVGGKDNVTAVRVAGPEFHGGSAGSVTGVRTRALATRPRMRVGAVPRLLTGRTAFLTYGLLLAMLVWAVIRAARG